MQSRVARLLGGLQSAVDSFEGTTSQLFETMIRLVQERLVDSDLGPIMRIMIAEGANLPALPAFHHREVTSRAKAILKGVVAQGLKRDEACPGAAADLPMILMAPAIMAAVWRMTFDPYEPVPPDRFLAAHLDLIRVGVLLEEPG